MKRIGARQIGMAPRESYSMPTTKTFLRRAWLGEGLCPQYHTRAQDFKARKDAIGPTTALIYIDIFKAHSEAHQSKTLREIYSYTHI
jgi:hypothetical protein